MTKSVKTIGVVGAGIMGAGIAQMAARSGYDVVLIDAKDEFVQRGMDRITSDLDKAVARERLSSADRDAAIVRITPTTNYNSLKSAQLVIEAVPETLEIKEPVLSQIAASVDADCIIASNTSSLSIGDLATFTSNPNRVVGMHFFNPVARMDLVEVVAGNNTDAAVADTIIAVAESMGKTPVRSEDQPGFIVNRILIPMVNEAILALQSGVSTAEGIDTAMKLGSAHPMGPLALADLIGLDVVLEIMRVLENSLGSRYAPADLLIQYVDAGRLGRKSGRGFFDYNEGN